MVVDFREGPSRDGPGQTGPEVGRRVPALVPPVPHRPGRGPSEKTEAPHAVASDNGTPDLTDPPCSEPEHRAADWAMPNATSWICGICHPTPEPIAGVAIRRYPDATATTHRRTP